MTTPSLSRRRVVGTLSLASVAAPLLAASPARAQQVPAKPAYPAFFEQVAPITLYEPFAEFLGASEKGLFEFRYVDAVRLAGHSCPTVAGAYLMALNGLKRLYGSALPQRGDIRVGIRYGHTHGTTGVTAAVLTLITGATEDMGYPGMGPALRFSRRNLLAYDQPVDSFITLHRRDTGAGIAVSLNADVVPADPEMDTLLPKAIANTLSAADMARFGRLWQDRVKRMLVDHAANPDLVPIRSL